MTKYTDIFCWKNVRSFCIFVEKNVRSICKLLSSIASFSHFFKTKCKCFSYFYKSFSHFFNKIANASHIQILEYIRYYFWNFNEMLANKVVSFEQPGPGLHMPPKWVSSLERDNLHLYRNLLIPQRNFSICSDWFTYSCKTISSMIHWSEGSPYKHETKARICPNACSFVALRLFHWVYITSELAPCQMRV